MNDGDARIATAKCVAIGGSGVLTWSGGVVDVAIRQIVARHGRLTAAIDAIAGGDDLYSLGLTSHTAVNLMLAIEDRFAIEFPDSYLTKSTFATLDSLVAAVRELVPA